MLVAAPLAFVIVSCHKSNTDESVTFANIVGNYKVASDIWTNGKQSFNFLDSVDVCQKDDIWEFEKDSIANYVDAGVVCQPNGSSSANWSLTGSTLILGGTPLTVKQLTSKQLVLVNVDNTVTPSVTETLTLARQ